jgi:excisionase family DNA binding protein
MKTLPKQALPQYYSPEEVAASLGVSRRSVYEWLADGSLKGDRAGRRWVISSDQVKAFVSLRSRPAVPRPTLPKQTVKQAPLKKPRR